MAGRCEWRRFRSACHARAARSRDTPCHRCRFRRASTATSRLPLPRPAARVLTAAGVGPTSNRRRTVPPPTRRRATGRDWSLDDADAHHQRAMIAALLPWACRNPINRSVVDSALDSGFCPEYSCVAHYFLNERARDLPTHPRRRPTETAARLPCGPARGRRSR